MEVGRLGPCGFGVGYYIYVGSARGPGGLRARVARHLRPAKKMHWHIDRLTAVLPVVDVWVFADESHSECWLAGVIGSMGGVTEKVTGFGSSDCSCASHLIGFRQKPGIDQLKGKISNER